jgi:protein-disulfide isomerase
MTPMTTRPRFIIAAVCAALLAASMPQVVRAQDFSPSQRRSIEVIVHNYLVAHPEVLQEAMAELERRQTAAEAEKHRAAVKEHAKTLYSSPRQVTLGNPNGNVTFVEFFDYNCGYCKRAMSDMLTLLKNDPQLKVVLKEFPVLGPGSVEAAEVAVAVRMQDKTGKKYLEFHTKLLGGRGQADKARALAVAKEVGLDMNRLEKDMASPEVKATLQEDLKLADALGLNGTPSYVIGSDVVVGAIGLPGLEEKVNTARCGKATC